MPLAMSTPVQDSFLHWKFAVAPCAALGFIIHAWDAWRTTNDFLSLTNVRVEAAAVTIHFAVGYASMYFEPAS